MPSPAAAIAWEFRQRHRWGLIGFGAYVVIVGVIKLFILAHGIPIELHSGESFAFVIMVPMTATFTYFLAVFTFGLDGDLAARQSMYPPRMLTLPVTTAALSGLPMLYGSAAMIVLWLATRLVALWPSGIAVPTIWPALLAASLLAWTQALTWMPYPLPGLRIIVTVLWLGTMDTIALIALHFSAHESLMIAIVAPQIPLAYVVARFAVARARRGEIPDWRAGFARLVRIPTVVSPRRDHFRSSASAQAWLEWRRHGLSLPAWVAILLPFELLILWAAGDSKTLVVSILLIVLLTPPFMATFAAASMSRSSPDAAGSYGVTPFIATRPLTNAELVAAKLKTTIWTTVVAWALVLVATPLALEWSGTSTVMSGLWRQLSQIVGTPRAVAVVVLIVCGCIASTWKQLVQGMYIGLTGRSPLVKGSVFLVLGFLFLFGPLGDWIIDNGHVGELWSALPFIFAVLVGLKMIVATWVVIRLYRGNVLSDAVLMTGAGAWCVAVLALYGVLRWLLDTPHIPHYLLMLVAILAIPLARLSAAPLALSWNRHR
jgi:hypothetical protein